METRATQSTVTFGRPFQLTGMDGVAPAGVYKLDVEEAKLDTPFESWRRTAVTLQISRASITEHVTLDPQELRDALVRDGNLSRNPVAAPPDRSRRLRGALRLRTQRP